MTPRETFRTGQESRHRGAEIVSRGRVSAQGDHEPGRFICRASTINPSTINRFKESACDEGRLGMGRRLAWWWVASLTLIASTSLAASGQSLWDTYNEGVRAYRAGQYTEALQRWQDLSLRPLPRGLRSPVPFQLGNAQFRLGEPLVAGAPEQAVEWWRRSLEAYRTALERSPRHPAARHNLELVQQRLARLLHRLGLEASEAATKQPLDPRLTSRMK